MKNGSGIRLIRFDEVYILGLFLILFAIMSVFSPSFLTAYNLKNLLCTASITGIMACGMTAVMATGGIDIAVGSTLGLGGAISAYVLSSMTTPSAWMVGVVMLMSVAVCGLVGLINGFVITKFNVPPLLATMGMQRTVRGLVYLVTGGKAIFFREEIPAYRWIGSGYVGTIPTLVIFFFLVALGIGWILKKTIYGRYLCSIGLNKDASYLSGVNTRRVTFSAYVICGLMEGLSGVILSSRHNSATPDAGVSYETTAITAIVLGGNSLTGGKASIFGAVIGTFIMVMLSNWLNLVGMQSIYQKIVTGTVLILVIVADRVTGLRGKLTR